jgi:hypothetical protein
VKLHRDTIERLARANGLELGEVVEELMSPAAQSWFAGEEGELLSD